MGWFNHLRLWLLLWLTLLTSVSLFIAEPEIIFHYFFIVGFEMAQDAFVSPRYFLISEMLKYLFFLILINFLIFSVWISWHFFLPCYLPMLILFLGYFLHINFLSTYWLNILTGMLYFDSKDELDQFRYLLFI